MDYPSQNQTTFIPRKSLVKEGTDREKPVGIFLIISVFIFAVAILGGAGVFLYEKKLTNDIASASESLKRAQGAFEIPTIENLKLLGRRIEVSKSLIQKHTVVSPVFELLQEETLKSVRFNKFEYTNDLKGGINIDLDGEAKSYETLALQSSEFAKNKNIKSNVFSNINLDEKGNVIFKVKLTLDPAVTSYRDKLLRSWDGNEGGQF